MKIKRLLLPLIAAMSLQAAIVGEVPKQVVLEGENGGLARDGSAWSSDTLKGKLFVLFYVDPDKKDVNEAYNKALKRFKKENRLSFQSVAIINLAATWKPDIIIEKLLQSKQKEFPDVIYVKDKHKVLVKEWGLKDDASDILIIDKSGKVIFYKAGKMDKADKEKSFALLKESGRI